MPHVIVMLWPGTSGAQKRRLSDAIVYNVTDILSHGEELVSVGFEEVSPNERAAHVYEPDILSKWEKLTKEPGYGPGPKSAD